MPVKTCLSNILSVRFDFGVPLEDVFPPYDIHPRLKYLFTKAFDAYEQYGTDVDFILRYGQAILSERLRLKDKLVISLDYQLNTEEYSPGTFFWLIRHFFGLLPLPILPSYTKDVHFYWNTLADKCKSVFKYHAHDTERDYLDYDIAQSLNMLPIENVILLNVLIQFLRKICMRKARGRYKFNRSSMMALSDYYCSSLFVRPFRPGHFQKNEYQPLLLYLILRWHHISKHCRTIGHPTYFLESDLNNMKCHQTVGSKNSNTQTSLFPNAFFNPEVITVCKKIPYFVEFCKKYLKDIACQTETDFSKEGEISSGVYLNSNEIKCKKEINNKENTYAYKLTCIEELEEDHGSTHDQVLENDYTLYQTARDFTFRSILDDEEKQDWPNILKETSETVKKVEEHYIYDDYETFKQEEFNQIGKSKTGSFLSRISGYSLLAASFKKSPRKEGTKASTPKKISPESENSYVKYPDVCDGVDSECSLKDFEYLDDKIADCEEIKITDHSIRDDTNRCKISTGQKLFQSNTPASIKGDDSKVDLQDENVRKNKRERYLLNRLRTSLEFLRTIAPNKSTFKMLETKVKYHRIKNGKWHTI